jgi:hypothetical protein
VSVLIQQFPQEEYASLAVFLVAWPVLIGLLPLVGGVEEEIEVGLLVVAVWENGAGPHINFPPCAVCQATVV